MRELYLLILLFFIFFLCGCAKESTCESAVKTAVYLASAGGSAPIWWITEFGLTAYHDMAVRKAWDDYYRCLEANV